MEKIYSGKSLVGIKISFVPNGSIPQTEGNEPLQVVTLKHPKGTSLAAHYHKPKKRVTLQMQECMIVKKGKVRLDIYTLNGNFIKNLFLSAGQLYISMYGGIGVKVLKNCELIEVKNGPFVEDKVLIKNGK